MEITDISWRFAVVVLLVLANGFFVAAEFSLVSVRRTRVDELVQQGNRRARVVRRSLRDLDSYIVAFAIITVLHIVFGELAPKTIALQRSEATSLWVAGPLELFLRAFRPIIFAMNRLGRLVVNAIGLQAATGHALVHSENELRMLVLASAQHGQLEEAEQVIIDRAFEFHDDTAADVMLPRTEMTALPLDAMPEVVAAALAEQRPARLPVYQASPDEVVGILHARDVAAVLARGGALDLAALTRPVLTIPETLPLDGVLQAMRAASTHVAVAVDEFGGTAGLVEVERVLARLVGPLPDEFARPEPDRAMVDRRVPTIDEIDGLTLVGDVNERYELTLDESIAHSIGGLVFAVLGRAPTLGDVVELDQARFAIIELDRLRISRLRIELLAGRDDRWEGSDTVSTVDRHSDKLSSP